MSAEQPDSGRASDVPTPNRREKKRVNWDAPNSNPGRSLTGNSSSSASGSSSGGNNGDNADADYSTLSPLRTPTFQQTKIMITGGELDANELTRKLTKVLSEGDLTHQEEERDEVEDGRFLGLSSHSRQASDVPHDGTTSGKLLSSAVKRPRPALRRNTSYDGPQERDVADEAERAADERKLQSISKAKERAEALAKQIGSHSAPGSRRNSDEIGRTFQPLIGDQGTTSGRRARRARPAVVVDDYDEEAASRDVQIPRPAAAVTPRGIHEPDQELRHRRGRRYNSNAHDPEVSDDEHHRDHPHPRDPDDDDSEEEFDEHVLAADLVRSHTRRRKKTRSKDLFTPRHPRVSGTSTPIVEQEYIQDYVPRPKKYRGGVLASLLALYNDDRAGGPGGSGSGGRGTPSSTAPATPLTMSPRSASPAPRARTGTGSGDGTPRSRPTSGLFNLSRLSHSRNNSTSTLALTELMKSSSMFAAPGSSQASGGLADAIRTSNAHQFSTSSGKSKKEQIKITVHIAAILSRHKYLLKLCRALMMYGAPTHRLEEYLIMSARVLEIDGQFLYIPSCMIISFDDSATHTTEVKIVRVPQGIDLGRLRDVHNIYKNVVHDKMGVDEATKLLDEVMARDPKFSVWFRVILYGVASMCVGPFAFKARFMDLPPAFLLGSLLGIMQLVLAPSNELYAHVFEVTASVVTSFLARGFGSIRGGELFCFSALAQSSIALILPGYMVLCSSLELQSHNIVAGSVRMVHAMIYTLFLGYGITIGASLYGMLDKNAVSDITCSEPLHRNWYFLFVPGFTLCLCLVNQSKWKQTPVMIVMALAGFVVNSYSSDYFGSGNAQISNMLGALTIGILANLYSRLGRHFENGWYEFLDLYEKKIKPRLSRLRNRKQPKAWSIHSDAESRPGSPIDDEKPKEKKRRQAVGYSLAAAAMLPAIFVQVPSGLAANGSLLAGINSANELTRQANGTASASSSSSSPTPFNVLLLVIQVAISISVGLFMSALIVYPLGKRRSGLFSF